MGPVEVLWDGDGVPPGKDTGPVEVLWDGDRVPSGKGHGTVEVLWDGDGLPSGCEQTDACENSTFPSYHGRGR